MLYRAVVGFLTLVTRVFFRSVEVSGLENVPADGPVIFVGNHPNSLLDPVLVITTCRRPVAFAAKETLFKGPLNPFLKALGAVPIKRRQDQVPGAAEDAPAADAPARVDNSEAFSALHAVLEGGGAFGIFPEGISHTRPELAPLKTGAARIALGAADKGVPVRIVPVGLTYRRRDRMRSRVLVQFGPPLVVEPAPAAEAEESAESSLDRARRLTGRIGQALRAQTINAADFETIRVLDGVRRLYKPDNVDLTLAQRAELMRRFINHWERFRHEPEIRAFYGDVESYLLSLRALGLTDTDLRGDPTSLINRAAFVIKHLVFSLVLVPAAIPGVVIHAPVLVAAVWAGQALTSRGDVRATIKMCAATLLTLAAYAVVAGLVLVRVPPPGGLAAAGTTLLALLLSGYATIRVLEKQSELRRGLSTLLALLHLDDEIARLAAERERLRARLLGLIDAYLGEDVPRIIDRAAHDDAKAWLDADDLD